MANHSCVNGTIVASKYSSPVPIIGLYIAGASLVCLLLMLYDIVVGFLARTRWLPGKLFTLNSVTLSLLGIAAKLPVDLTTSMPSDQDQLSKLTGTVLTCISMGFLMPSLGVNSESECLTNLVALSIFVVTLGVNICIQIYTGVIVLFVVEHIIILFFMLLLLLMLWQMSLYIKSHKRITTDQYKDLFLKGISSMFERLKCCYLYAYCSNPQFEISMHPMYVAVCTICLVCSVILIQATFRSLILKQLHFCSGVSDYGWSMPIIVVSQILTVVVGTSAIVFRCLALFSRMEFEEMFVSHQDADDVIQRNPTLGRGSTLRRLKKFFISLNQRIVLIAQLLIVSPSVLVRYFLCVHKQDRLEYFDDLPHEGTIAATCYRVQKSVDDMIKLREVCDSESLNNLLQLLSEATPQRVRNMEIRDERYSIKVSSLSMALLVRIVQVSIPENHLGSLVHAFDEAYEIIHFIDKTINPTSLENNNKLSYSKAVWRGGNFSCLLPDIIGNPHQLQSDMERAVLIITKLKDILPTDEIWSHVGIIVDFINRKSYSSMEDLCTSTKQLFVDMLHALFTQLPIAIFKSLIESPAEEFEERARVAMKFLFKTKCLEAQINWSFPAGSNMSRLITDGGFDSRVLTGPFARL